MRFCLQIDIELDRQEQGVEKLRAQGSEDREMITQWLTSLAGDDGFERASLRLIRPFVNDDLPLAVSVRDLARWSNPETV